MATEDLLRLHGGAWQAATRHPFLDAVREGTLAEQDFERWLGQDYLFVADLLRFQARLLARAPRTAQAVLAGGVVALEAELTWFEQHAQRRGLALDGERLEATEGYRACLERLDLGAYEPALVALWALERAYLQAWQSARPGAPAFREFVEHWTVPVILGHGTGGRRPMSVATVLWIDNQDLARQALEHPFVRGIGAGTLPRSSFAQFVAQDAYFLDAFARAYALALVRSPDRDGVYDFARLLDGALEELKLHGSYSARWGIDLANVVPTAATLAYTDFLLRRRRT